MEQVARELGVRYVLEGSVRKAGNRVRVTGQLIDGRTGGHLWADRFDRDLTDIFAIQDEITHAIVEQLKVKLLPEERAAVAKTPTSNIDAYTYYLKGRQFSQNWSKSYLELARRMFARAAELDPGYARAFAGIADCDSALHAWHRVAVAPEALLAVAEQALALDPDLPEAHASRGFALHVGGRHVEAAAEFERALGLDPNLYEAAFYYGRLCFTQGDFARAAGLFERAAELRVDDYRTPVLLTAAYRSLGRDADRIRAAQAAVERAEQALELHPENAAPAHLGAVALAHLGDRERARKWAARALAVDPDDSGAQYNLACAYCLIGDLDEAIELLEKSVAASTSERALWFQQDSDLEALRGHPRYLALLESVRARLQSES
jgi:adenylate cyclase